MGNEVFILKQEITFPIFKKLMSNQFQIRKRFRQ